MKNLYDKNFWEVHPEYLLITEFKDYYSKDTSKDKQYSSKILWAVYFAYNPESRFYNIPDKLDILTRDFIKDPKFKFASIKNIIDITKRANLKIIKLSFNDSNGGSFRIYVSKRNSKFEELVSDEKMRE